MTSPKESTLLTIRYLTKYERARLLGTRALQISLNAPILVDIDDTQKDLTASDIAKMEFDQGKIPLQVVRTLPNGVIEVLSLSDLKQ